MINFRDNFIRRQTNLEHAEASLTSHSYLLRKPRTHEPTDDSLNPQTSGENEVEGVNPIRERRRFELFIDLIWVGIVANLADHFSEQAFSPETTYTLGRAILEFLILFLMAWRMWKFLQEFMGKYRTNDIVERLFVVWALILALGWGNNAPWVLDPDEPSSLAISLYLVFKASVLLVESYYAMHLPHLRRRIILQTALSIPILGLWLPAFWYEYPKRAGLLLAAIILEYWSSSFIDTPWAARFIKDDRKELLHTGHWVERVQDFYIIILGEGIMNLIRGSPLGKGITPTAGAGVSVLWVFYVLSCLFFNGDLSRRYIHAMRRTWWRRVIWLSIHVTMFGCTLIMGVCLTHLIQNIDVSAKIPERMEGESEKEFEEARKLALSVSSSRWCASSTLGIILINLTKVALLNRSLDGPNTLKINNRYVRVFPRIIAAIVIICLPIDTDMTCITYLGILTAILIPLMTWEWVASLEAGGGLIEPEFLKK
ncbi:hypothetical protein ACLMJK_005675 [Lecanora helva]